MAHVERLTGPPLNPRDSWSLVWFNTMSIFRKCHEAVSLVSF